VRLNADGMSISKTVWVAIAWSAAVTSVFPELWLQTSQCLLDRSCRPRLLHALRRRQLAPALQHNRLQLPLLSMATMQTKLAQRQGSGQTWQRLELQWAQMTWRCKRSDCHCTSACSKAGYS